MPLLRPRVLAFAKMAKDFLANVDFLRCWTRLLASLLVMCEVVLIMNKNCKVSLLALLLAANAWFCSHSFADHRAAHKSERPTASSGGSIRAMVEDQYTMTATGYAVIAVQRHSNPAQQRLMAIRAGKMDAYRSLAAQVYGQHVNSTTTVGDLIVGSDVFRARIEGVIYGAELVSIETVGDDTYAVTLSLGPRVVNDLRKLYLKYSNQFARKAS